MASVSAQHLFGAQFDEVGCYFRTLSSTSSHGEDAAEMRRRPLEGAW